MIHDQSNRATLNCFVKEFVPVEIRTPYRQEGLMFSQIAGID